MTAMIDTLPLFPELGAGLLALLGDLSPDDWRKPTVHHDRDVKDLAAHLLDTALRRLAMQRDGFFAEAPGDPTFNGLVHFIQRMNRAWMDAARRLSPRMLVEMLARTELELFALLEKLPTDEPAIFAVAWAGESVSKNWFDVAREYTERWHHQQQIRDAVGRPGFTERRFLHPVLATFALGLPHAYRDVTAAKGTKIAIEITGEASDRWTIERGAASWALVAGGPDPDASIALPGDTAWRLWTKSIDHAQARVAANVSGLEAFIAPLFSFVAIMA